MTRWSLLFISLFLFGFTPIYDKHEQLEQIDEELKEIESTVQPKQFRVFPGTPTLNELENNQIVIISSNGWTALMWRNNSEIFKVNGSCVTVIR